MVIAMIACRKVSLLSTRPCHANLSQGVRMEDDGSMQAQTVERFSLASLEVSHGR
jgi:hypothetical protein